MSQLLFPTAPLLLNASPSNSKLVPSFPSRFARVRATVASSSTERKPRRRRKQTQQQQSDVDPSSSSYGSYAVVSATEKSLSFAFMKELMERARNCDAAGVSDVIYDMIATEQRPGPRSFHGLVIANVLNGDHEGAMQSLRRELSAGLRPLHETFISLIQQ